MRRPRAPGPLAPGLVAACAACLVAACASASPERPESPAPRVPARVAVLADPHASAIALAVAVPGSTWEDEASVGLALLAARALLEQVAPELAALGAEARVACDRAAFVFHVLAPPDHWRPAVGVFLDGIFRPRPAPEALDRARYALAVSLGLDQASPAWQARLAARQALYGGDAGQAAWARPPCGVPEALGLFDLEDVTHAAARFRAGPVAAVLTGPMDAVAARSFLVDGMPGVVARPGDGPLPAAAPERTAAGRRYVERNTVTAWVSLAFPFGTGADPEAVRLLGAAILDDVGPGLDRPDMFDASIELERHGDGGALILHLVTAPESAARYADRIEALVARIARHGPHPAVHERVLRRHRGLRLRALATPEARVAAAALDLVLGGAVTGTAPLAPAQPDPESLSEAAAALGPAARAVTGPRAARPAVSP